MTEMGGSGGGPMVEPGAPGKVVTLKPLWWSSESPPTVTLRPRRSSSDEWEVFHEDTWVGTVTRYRGSLDRPCGRLRIPGKMRILWAFCDPGSRYTMWGQVSRADCIRSLVGSNARRSAAQK